MGLDIYLSANHTKRDSSSHTLSRTFCYFMSRQNVIHHQPELDQIGKLIGVDISSIYEMETYPDGDEMYFILDGADTEEERQQMLKGFENAKAKLEGNLDKVFTTVNALIEKLTPIQNLPDLLLPTERDTLDNQTYFANFTLPQGKSYVENNFGQDLRDFKSFLEFVKERGATTVWFNYY